LHLKHVSGRCYHMFPLYFLWTVRFH
jgi:hypothetical protein